MLFKVLNSYASHISHVSHISNANKSNSHQDRVWQNNDFSFTSTFLGTLLLLTNCTGDPL